MRIHLVSLVACFTLQNLKDEGCRVACIMQGNDGGISYAPGCRCFNDTQKYEDFINRRVSLGSSDQIGPQTDAPFLDYKRPIIIFDKTDGFKEQ